MKNSSIIVVSVGLFALSSVVFAETSSTTPRDIREGMRKETREFHQEVEEKREEMKEEIRDRRASTTDAIRDKRFELNRNASTTPEDRIRFRASMELMRKETHDFAKNQQDAFRAEFVKRKEALKDTLDGERKMLREKLAKIKDERKKQTVETISNRLAEINNNVLDNLTKFLDHQGEILVKIKTRADVAGATGKDIAKTKTAILQAETAIKNAREAIKTQVGKTYPINVTTESTLGSAVSKARNAVHDDLEKVRTLVRTAHTAIRTAARSLHDIPRVDDDDDNSTSTSTPSTATTTSQ